jgi:hypothetical protein
MILLVPRIVFAQIPTVQIISPENGDMFSDNTITAEGFVYDTTDYVVSVKVKTNVILTIVAIGIQALAILDNISCHRNGAERLI